ncbi:MAG: pitrilysin family protein [Clostridia bacterium]|nr:pitrilysin family protein [Clostridia bacterium]
MSEIITIENSKLKEKYHVIKHESGLTVYVWQKPDYTSKYAIFGTNYGSIDTAFENKDGEKVEIPNGTAHFLEHKLFESEELDAFERYAQTGASANAYTSFDKTCYLFSCTDNFNESLDILLDFVRHPYFTKKTVEKEQGIIGQEIKMYKDIPSWEILFNLLSAMFHNHPVKIDIAGTVDSISQIDDKMLYACYENYYSLDNMALVVVGDVDVSDVMKLVDKNIEKTENKKFKRIIPKEPESIVQKYIEEKLPVSRPMFAMGYKENVKPTTITLKDEYVMELLMDILFSKSSDLYEKLIENKLINSTFSYEYFSGFGYSVPMLSGESDDIEKATQMIKSEIQKYKENGVDIEEFDRQKKRLYGNIIKGYNDIENVANELIACHFEDKKIFDYPEVLKNITPEDVNIRLREVFKDDKLCVSIIKNSEEV